jgi:hypothetical protein
MNFSSSQVHNIISVRLHNDVFGPAALFHLDDEVVLPFFVSLPFVETRKGRRTGLVAALVRLDLQVNAVQVLSQLDTRVKSFDHKGKNYT